MEQRIDRHEHLNTVPMGITNDLSQVLDAVSRCLSCAIRGGTDIDSVRAGLDSSFRYFFVASRREEAKRYITIPAVTETFIECFVPYWGISIHCVQLSTTSCCTPKTSCPKTIAVLGQFEI